MIIKIMNYLLIAISIVVLGSCNQSTKKTANIDAADAIYYGGDIVTMERESATYAEAVAVKSGKIVFVGTKADAVMMQGDSTKMNDLQGKTLLPGFIDSHSHLANAMNIMAQANVSSQPVGNCSTVPQHDQGTSKM